MTLTQIISAFSFLIVIAFSCSDDVCEVSPIDDPTRYLSITGKVINAYDDQGIEGVRLSMLDQFGGSFIIKWDTMQYSGKEGCFKYEEERDMDFLNELTTMDPSLRFDQINQSLRTKDDRYYFLKSKQGIDEILSFRRWTYDSAILVEMFVVPSATIDFNINDMANSRLTFRWSFEDPTLLGFNQISTFLIDPENKWQIPAEREILIEVLDENRVVIHTEQVLASLGQQVLISF